MPKQDDISSTERLLNVIRNTDSVKETPVFQPPTSKRSFKTPFSNIFMKSAPSVGIDISGDCIRLVKTESSFNRKPAILDFRSVPLVPGVAEDRSQMIDILRSQLADFCTAVPQPAIWTALPQEETDIRRLRIPRISGDKLEKAVYWTCQKEAPFNKDQTIFNFHLLGNVIENGVAKTEVLVSTTPKGGVENLKSMFKAAGYELTGIIAPSFAIQNYFKTDWLDMGEGLACSLLIDFNWSRIDIIRPGGDLVVSRGIKAGINSMIESIKNEAAGTTDGIQAPDDLYEGGQVLDLPAFDVDEADQAMEILNVDAAASTSAVSGLPKDDDVFDMVLPALERLIRQVERTLEHVALRYSDGPMGSILISGPITAYPRLVNHVGNQLDLPPATIDPFASVASGIEAPKTISDRAVYVSSVGLALSAENRTPNFLLTHRETGVKRRKTRINQAIAVLFLLGMAVLWGIHHFQLHHIKDLEAQISQLGPVADPKAAESDREALLSLAERTNAANRTRKIYAAKSLPAAMIAEIITLAPEDIRFIRVEGENLPDDEKTVFVEALVYGPRGSMETRLAGYLMSLNRSPFFSQVALKKQLFERLGSQDVLRFTLDLEGV